MPDNIKLEKIMSQYTKTLIETSFGELPENYYGVAVDIYKSSYGNICHISILFKNPMTKDEMDYFDRQSRLNVTREATKVFPPDLINEVAVRLAPSVAVVELIVNLETLLVTS